MKNSQRKCVCGSKYELTEMTGDYGNKYFLCHNCFLLDQELKKSERDIMNQIILGRS